MNLNIILGILKRDIDINEMIVIGGMAKGRVQLQILADVFGMDILKMTSLEEATSMGAAITAGVGIGELEGFHEIDKFNTVAEVISPNKDSAEKYGKIKPVFDSAYFALEDVYKQLSML